MSTRYFSPCKGFIDVRVPERSTKSAAGYDFFAYEDVTIPSIWKSFWKLLRRKPVKPTMVATHVKAKMRSNEVLMLFSRSSNPFKGLLLSNGVGIVDADYFCNPQNDGDIGFAFYNVMPWDIKIEKGQRIGQGVFTGFLKTENDTSSLKREGGFGSTGE